MPFAAVGAPDTVTVGTKTKPDPEDGLPATEVGIWTKDEKHFRVGAYVQIYSAARRKFLGRRNAGATYIELFSGPGRSFIKYTDDFIDGSPLVAFKQSVKDGAPFSSIYVCDENAEFAEAAQLRLETYSARVKCFHGPAEDTVDLVIKELHRYGLHFAFLDPFSLQDLPFSIVKRLAAFRRMDMLIHLSAMDLKMNLQKYILEDPSPLDKVFPGWRTAVRLDCPEYRIREQLLQHYITIVRNLGFKTAKGILVTAKNNLGIYWLIFASHHPLAIKFWNTICNVSPQHGLFEDGENVSDK